MGDGTIATGAVLFKWEALVIVREGRFSFERDIEDFLNGHVVPLAVVAPMVCPAGMGDVVAMRLVPA